MQSMCKVSAILPLYDGQNYSDLFCYSKFRFEIFESLETMAVLKLILVLSILIIPALCLEINFVPLFIKYEQFGCGCKDHSIDPPGCFPFYLKR